MVMGDLVGVRTPVILVVAFIGYRCVFQRAPLKLPRDSNLTGRLLMNLWQLLA